MKILLKIAIVAVAAAFMAGCCNCRSYQKKTRRPLAGTEWQLIQLGGKAVKPEEGKFTVTLLAEGNRLMEEMKKQIETEKESAIRDIRRQVAVLSVGIAEKIMRNKLADEKEQAALIDRLLDEMIETSKK